MSFDINEMFEQEEVRDLKITWGYDMAGAELKTLVPNPGDEVVIAFGLGKLETVKVGSKEVPNYKDDVYLGADILKLNTVEFWQNTSELTPLAAEQQGKDDKDFSFSTTFIAPAKPNGTEWYTDLGYASTRQEEGENLADGKVTVESYLQARGGKWFDGNTVLRQLWYNIPVVTLDITKNGKNRDFKITGAYWLKLKGAAGRGQSGSLMTALKTFSERNDPSVYGGLIKITREGNFYTFTPYSSDAVMDDDTRQTVEEYFESINEFITNRFSTIFTERHGGHPVVPSNKSEYELSNNYVRSFLVNRTEGCETWADFVDKYNILSGGIDVAELESVSIIDIDEDDVPF